MRNDYAVAEAYAPSADITRVRPMRAKVIACYAEIAFGICFGILVLAAILAAVVFLWQQVL